MAGSGAGERGTAQMSQWWFNADMYSERHWAAAWYDDGSGAYVSSLPSSFSRIERTVAW